MSIVNMKIFIFTILVLKIYYTVVSGKAEQVFDPLGQRSIK